MLKRSSACFILFFLIFSLSITFAYAKAGTCINPNGGNYCNKKSELSSCYCDQVCSKYGDCCDDYKQICDVSTKPASSTSTVVKNNPNQSIVKIVRHPESPYGNVNPGTSGAGLFKFTVAASNDVALAKFYFNFKGSANPYLTNVKVIDLSTNTVIATAASLPEGFSSTGPKGAVVFDIGNLLIKAGTEKDILVTADVSAGVGEGSDCATCSVWVYAAMSNVDAAKGYKATLSGLPVEGHTIIIPYASSVSTCTDSDGGKNEFLKGTVKGLAGDGQISTDTDFCRENNYYGDGYDYVVEWFCDDTTPFGKGYRFNDNIKCINGCKDGACVQSSGITVDKVETDKKFYGLNEKVSISATATSSAGFPKTLTAEVQNPNYQGTKVTMTPSACNLAKTNSNVPITCTYKGIFANTTYEGYYNVNVATGDFNSNAYTSFSVLDNEKAGKFLILNDIGLYKFANAWHFLDTSQGIDTYGAYYSTGKLSNQASVYVFSSREYLFIFLNKALEQINYYTQTIDGNLVYVVSDGNSQAFAWTRDNLLIVSVSTPGSSVQYGSDAVNSAASKKAQPPSSKKVKPSITSIFGNVVASQTKTTTTTTASLSYDEVVLAYLNKHPSDLDKAPPTNKITKEDVIKWINVNCADSTYPPVPVIQTSSKSSASATGKAVSKISK